MGCKNSLESEDQDDVWLCEFMNTILAVKASIGLLSLIAGIISFILLFMFRRYKKDHLTEIGVTERLILYSAVAAIARSVVVILQLTEVNYYSFDWMARSAKYILVQLDLCMVIGLLDVWSTWTVLLTTQMIMVHLFIQLTLGVDTSKKLTIEIFYVTFPVVFPLLFVWAVPFSVPYDYYEEWPYDYYEDQEWLGYSITVAGCGIKGLYNQIIFLLGPMIIFTTINIIFISVEYPKLFFEKIKKEDRSDLIKQHAPLLLLLLLSVVTNFIVFGNRLFFGFHNNAGYIMIQSHHTFAMSMWIIHAIASSCSGIVSAIVIMLYLLALCRLQPHERHHDDNDQCQDNPVFNVQMQLNYSSCGIESSGEI